MDHAYAILFEVRFRCDYFANGKAEVFSVSPGATTAQALANAQCLFRAQPDGFLVLAPVQQETDYQSVLSFLDRNFCFTFVVRNTDPLLVNYAQIGIPGRGKAYRFSNVDGSTVTNNELWSSGTDASAFEVDLQPLRFSYPFAEPQTDYEVAVTDVYTNTVLSQTLAGPAASYPVDLSTTGEGDYTLALNGKEQSSFFAIDLGMNPEPLAVIEIGNVDSSTGQPQLVGTGGRLTAATYTVTLPVRPVTYNYYIVDRGAQDPASIKALPDNPEQLAITDSSDEQVFEVQGTTELPDGNYALLLVGQGEVDLKEQPEERYRLRSGYSSPSEAGKLLADPLPCASPSSLRVDDTTRSKYAAQLFIYV